jgi:hypothetical protein
VVDWAVEVAKHPADLVVDSMPGLLGAVVVAAPVVELVVVPLVVVHIVAVDKVVVDMAAVDRAAVVVLVVAFPCLLLL